MLLYIQIRTEINDKEKNYGKRLFEKFKSVRNNCD